MASLADRCREIIRQARADGVAVDRTNAADLCADRMPGHMYREIKAIVPEALQNQPVQAPGKINPILQIRTIIDELPTGPQMHQSRNKRMAYQTLQYIEEDLQKLQRSLNGCRIKGEEGILNNYAVVMEEIVSLNEFTEGKTADVVNYMLDGIEDEVSSGLREKCGCRTSI